MCQKESEPESSESVSLNYNLLQVKGVSMEQLIKHLAVSEFTYTLYFLAAACTNNTEDRVLLQSSSLPLTLLLNVDKAIKCFILFLYIF